MKKAYNDRSTVESLQEDQKGLFQDAKRLKLTTENQEEFELTSLEFTDLKKDMTSNNLNLPSAISEIFELVSQFYMNLDETENEDYMNSFLSFLMSKLDMLFTSVHQDETNKREILAKLLLQLLAKHFDPTKLTHFNPHFFIYLKQTRNNKLIVELLNIWLNVKQDLYEIKSDLLPYLKRNLKNNDHRVRSKCLGILALHYSDHELFANNNKLIKILLNFTDDQDPRVRATAFEALIMLHMKGMKLSTDYYDDLKPHLNDDFEHVRILCIHALFLLASSYPEYMIKVGHSQEDDQIRLVDDIFARICHMINDISVEVKVCASNLLGKMKGVSAGFLVQTLDKKLMSDLKMKQNRQRLKQLVTSEFSSNFSAGGSSDSTITEDDNLSLMSSGACGAFIHGLEDECLEVRSEAVDALCGLAINCPELAAKCIDFLVDMFNDEIEMVRLKAIQALTKISHFVLLGDDQVDIVLSVIEDYSLEVREALKDLLANCKLATKIGLKKATQALFKNLRKYSFDQYSIWKCFKSLGINHSKFVMSLVSYLIGLHPFLDVTEPDMSCPFYTGSLILIYNGCAKNSAILPLLPKFVINHYFFLKLKLPDLVPSIKLIETFPVSIFDNKNYSINKKNRVDKFYENMIENLRLVERSELDMAKTLEFVCKDMEFLSQTDSDNSIACEIMKIFIECYMIKDTKRHENQQIQSTIDCDKLIQIENALVLNIKLLVLYKGYSIHEKITLFKMYLFLRGYYLKEFYKIKVSLNSNTQLHNNIVNSYLKKNIFKQDLIKECYRYLSFIGFFESVDSIQANKFLSNILTTMAECEKNPLSIIELLNSPLFTDFSLDLLILKEQSESYTKCSLNLIEPKENLETPMRFTPGLICSINVKAVLDNFTRFDNLYIQISYSDNDKNFIPIELRSIQKINDTKHLIDTHVNLSNLAWTDTCYVKLSVIMLIDEYGDFRESVLELTGCHQKLSFSDAKNKNSLSYKSQCEVIDLSGVVKVYFEPQLTKKFIHV